MWNAWCRAEQDGPRLFQAALCHLGQTTVFQVSATYSPHLWNQRTWLDRWSSKCVLQCAPFRKTPQGPFGGGEDDWANRFLASLWHSSLIIICLVCNGLRKLKASTVTTSLDRRVLSISTILWPYTVARAGTQTYTSPPMGSTPGAGVRGQREECGSGRFTWARVEHRGISRVRIVGGRRLEGGWKRASDRGCKPGEHQTAQRQGQGHGEHGAPSKTGEEKWRWAKAEPCVPGWFSTPRAQDTLLTSHGYKCPLSNASFLRCFSSYLQTPYTFVQIWISVLKGLAQVFLHLGVNTSFDNKNKDRLWEASCEGLLGHSLI